MIKEHYIYNGRYKPLLSIDSIKDLFVEVIPYKEEGNSDDHFRLYIEEGECYHCLLSKDFMNCLRSTIVTSVESWFIYFRVTNGRLTLHHNNIISMYTITHLDIEDIEAIYDESVK
ncbi:hypothetical protein HOR87_gp08 [Marinomonas phage CB5A]|uniref:Uncharacterized protein n=1 Tax=Marinomonas phage CB5A TaxID=2022859 RepID=A0A222G2V0_9CAUD|nr:hypothetical protein HOR87_gp08 [Marinomonas phage CB5A]ASP46247.1 hypothetical protein [Marinomonas phage CB5A]